MSKIDDDIKELKELRLLRDYAESDEDYAYYQELIKRLERKLK